MLNFPPVLLEKTILLIIAITTSDENKTIFSH